MIPILDYLKAEEVRYCHQTIRVAFGFKKHQKMQKNQQGNMNIHPNSLSKPSLYSGPGVLPKSVSAKAQSAMQEDKMSL